MMWYWINVHTHAFADTRCIILGRIGGISDTGTGTTLLYLQKKKKKTSLCFLALQAHVKEKKYTSQKCYISRCFRQCGFLLPRRSMCVTHAVQIELALLSPHRLSALTLHNRTNNLATESYFHLQNKHFPHCVIYYSKAGVCHQSPFPSTQPGITREWDHIRAPY